MFEDKQEVLEVTCKIEGPLRVVDGVPGPLHLVSLQCPSFSVVPEVMSEARLMAQFC